LEAIFFHTRKIAFFLLVLAKMGRKAGRFDDESH
jgi:hypothetical protein